MLAIEEINFNDMKTAVRALNESNLLEVKIKTVGIKKEVMLNEFTMAVEDINDQGKTDKLPTAAIAFYNSVFADEVDPDETEVEEKVEAEVQPEPKEEEPKKKKSQPKKTETPINQKRRELFKKQKVIGGRPKMGASLFKDPSNVTVAVMVLCDHPELKDDFHGFKDALVEKGVNLKDTTIRYQMANIGKALNYLMAMGKLITDQDTVISASENPIE
jgi:hypothetical protein